MIQVMARRQPIPALDLTSLARQALQPWSDAYETWRSGVADLVDRTAPKAGRHCDCPSCGADPCACRCCVAESDLLVETRVGERRIVPILIENRWRRERDIELELSSWTKTSQGVVVSGEILGETAIKLAPCGEAKVLLALEIAGPQDGTDGNRQGVGDISQCAVAYADLRIKGCDLRSIRIAVAVLPQDCDPYRVDCACGCC
jgi:hypothetical protein